ncbi:hypothetical protein FH972_013248 [Carpinus fangiana]|uniref:Uncharacterized protein n=1 Tax=Carpinus fangiana TaxID=176857 RepID=A0A5N6Q7D2_9ROSI|nr:hypothetical protein FH972_027359 [Carpinus fangiana]KAE8056477.1 hypothetical protein FH972_013248 [Carpinus fangiana]
MAAARITNWGFLAANKAPTSLWWVRSSLAWVHKTRLAKPRWRSFYTVAGDEDLYRRRTILL